MQSDTKRFENEDLQTENKNDTFLNSEQQPLADSPTFKSMKKFSYNGNQNEQTFPSSPLKNKHSSQQEFDEESPTHNTIINNFNTTNFEGSMQVFQKQERQLFQNKKEVQDEFDKDSEQIQERQTGGRARSRILKRSQVVSEFQQGLHLITKPNQNNKRLLGSDSNISKIYFRNGSNLSPKLAIKINRKKSHRNSDISSLRQEKKEEIESQRKIDLNNLKMLIESENSKDPKNSSLSEKPGWFYSSVLDKVKLFIQKLKNLSTFTYGFSNVNNKHLDLIDDCADARLQPQASNSQLAWILTTLSKIPIVQPDSALAIIWNFLLSFVILIQFVMIPLKICFQLSFQTSQIEVLFYYTPAIIFVMEIFVRLNISYYFEGVLIDDRSKIISYYLFKTYYFWIDLITTLTFLLSKDINHPLLIFVVIFRFLQFTQLIREIDEHFQISQRFSTVWNLGSLFLIIILLAHFTGCGFHYIAIIQDSDGTKTWLTKAQIQDETWQVRFLYSIYWSSITMITVGYGDIVPISSAEKIYVIVMTLISAGVFAYSVNTIGTIFTEYSKKQEVLKAQKHDISIYMRTRGISGQTQIETLKYLDYVNQEEMEATKRGQQVISLLSDSIKEKLQADYFGRVISESPLFSSYSPQFLIEVAQIMKERLYGPGELIFSKGDLDSRLFFIVKGQLQLFLSRKRKKLPIIISTLDKGEVGHNGFFAEQPRATSLKSLNVCHTIIIQKEDILPILEKFPLDLERFCLVKDSMQQNLQKQKFNCFACGIAGHNIINCQRIHYQKSQWFTILRFNYSKSQERQKYSRSRDKINAYKIQRDVRFNLIRLRGKKTAEITSILFDKEGEDWLTEQKDKTFFALLPRLAYKNDQYTIDSDSDQSAISDSIFDGSDALSEQPSILEQSLVEDQHFTKKGVKSSSPLLTPPKIPHQLGTQEHLSFSHREKEGSVLKYSTFKQSAGQTGSESQSTQGKEDTKQENQNKRDSANSIPDKKQFSNNKNDEEEQNETLKISSMRISRGRFATISTPNRDIFTQKDNPQLDNFIFNGSQLENCLKTLVKSTTKEIVNQNQVKDIEDEDDDDEFSIYALNANYLDGEEGGGSQKLKKQINLDAIFDIPTPLAQAKEEEELQKQNKAAEHLSMRLSTSFSSSSSSSDSSSQSKANKNSKKKKSDPQKIRTSFATTDQVNFQSDNPERRSSAFAQAIGALLIGRDQRKSARCSQQLSMHQRVSLLKMNGGSFKSVMQKKQEFQKDLKRRSSVFRQDSTTSVKNNAMLQKQLSRILETSEILAPYKQKLERTLTPKKINKLLNLQNLNYNYGHSDLERKTSNVSLLHKASFQGSPLYNPSHKIPQKDFHHPLSLQKQICGSTSQIIRQMSGQTVTSGQVVAQDVKNLSHDSIKQSTSAPKQQQQFLEDENFSNYQAETFFCLDGLDNLRNYEIYFPDQNCVQILKSYGHIRLLKVSQQKRSKKKHQRKNTLISQSSAQNKKLSKFFRQFSTKIGKQTRTFGNTQLSDGNPIKLYHAGKSPIGILNS